MSPEFSLPVTYKSLDPKNKTKISPSSPSARTDLGASRVSMTCKREQKP